MDHLRYIQQSSNGANAAKIGVSKEDAHALYMAYGWDEEGNDIAGGGEWGEEAFNAVQNILEKNIRVLLYGSKEAVLDFDMTVGSPNDVGYLSRIMQVMSAPIRIYEIALPRTEEERSSAVRDLWVGQSVSQPPEAADSERADEGRFAMR